ncbi:MAG: PaaI family thioesterase [Caulobacterales bacterium]|jgi:uncharacterized protein (TIGR00369 family)
MNDVVSPDGAGETVTDEDLLARFQRSTTIPPGSLTLGFRILKVSQADNCVEALFAARPEFANPMGQIQGGFLTAMLDEVMSISGLVASRMTCVMPTLEMKTSFLRPAVLGTELRGVGRVLKWGKTIAFTEGELFDDQARLIAKATATAMPTPFSRFKKP